MSLSAGVSFRGTLGRFNAKFFRLIAAFKSLSNTAPQSQVHSLSDNFNSELIAPQCRHRRDDGKNLSAVFNSDPYHSLLYPICLRNSANPTSLIACARQWFFTIPATFRSSRTITLGLSLFGLVFATIDEVALCNVSRLMLAMR